MWRFHNTLLTFFLCLVLSLFWGCANLNLNLNGFYITSLFQSEARGDALESHFHIFQHSIAFLPSSAIWKPRPPRFRRPKWFNPRRERNGRYHNVLMLHEHRPFSHRTAGNLFPGCGRRATSPHQPLLGKRARCSQWLNVKNGHVEWYAPTLWLLGLLSLFPCSSNFWFLLMQICNLSHLFWLSMVYYE